MKKTTKHNDIQKAAQSGKWHPGVHLNIDMH